MLATVVAVGSLGVAIAAFAISVWVALVAKRGLTVNAANLTLTAYSAAIQGGILNLKSTFADQPDIFARQMQLAPDISQLIPDYMRDDIPAFLAFAGGMWRLSYVYSVIKRRDELGLWPQEYLGLKNEMELWLTGIPGFYDVYRTHTSQLEVHNPDFLDYLKTEIYTTEFCALAGAERELGPDHPETIAARKTLASWYESAGRLTKATPLYERALADAERVLGVDHVNTAALRDIVTALRDQTPRSTIASQRKSEGSSGTVRSPTSST